MPDNAKELQRAELHKTIWAIADDLRGSVYGWDFKQYILCTLFYRFISENLCTYLAQQEQDPTFDYSKLPDSTAEFGRAETVAEKGFFILPSELFCNILTHVDKDGMRLTDTGKDLNELLEQVFNNIEGSAVGTSSEGDLKGLFDDMDVNSAKLGTTATERNKKLVKLITGIASLDFGGTTALMPLVTHMNFS